MNVNLVNFPLIIIGILVVFSVVLSLYARRTLIFPGDLRLTLLLQSIINPTLTSIMEWVSILFTGWPACLIVFFSGVILYWRLGKLEGILIWLAGLFSLFSEIFKRVIARPRPSAEQVKILMNETGYGFPSGHAFFSVLFLGILAYLLFTRIKNRNLKIFSLIVLIILILLIGTSRVYLGDHWPSDVLGGYVLGSVFLGIFIWFDRISKRRNSIL